MQSKMFELFVDLWLKLGTFFYNKSIDYLNKYHILKKHKMHSK